MKLKYIFTFAIIALLVFSKESISQIETRLATNCATKNVEVPINLKNLEDIKSFQLKLRFSSDLLQLDTSYYHFQDFANNVDDIYRIKVSASNDTITIKWSAFYAVSVTDELLLALSFSEIASGQAVFEWLESACYYTNINNLNVPSQYLIDSPINIPFDSNVKITFEQFTIGCRDNSENGGCKAQAEVNIAGGQSPYEYHWQDRFNQNDSIAIGLCQDPVSVVIRDAASCIYASIFDPEIYPAINPEDVSGFKITYSPEEVFITKPNVDFSVETGTSIIEKYDWDFGDESFATTESTSHTYNQVGNYLVSLRTENIDGCDTTITLNLEIKELNFCIPNVFTPNGDNINDTWIFKIVGSDGGSDGSTDGFKSTGLSEPKKCSGEDLIFADHFKSSSLVVLNRNGSTVYECSNCTEYWDGGNLPDGVYFYVFTWEGEYSQGKEQGNVTILGSQN